ncbi:MAG: hypothetical protein KDJ65_34665 [Anaerolineae bacterium]|nr:hypothetical protein [Anaerolineae bacterium]
MSFSCWLRQGWLRQGWLRQAQPAAGSASGAPPGVRRLSLSKAGGCLLVAVLASTGSASDRLSR